MTLYGGIEGGGTKFVCAVGTGPDDIRAETRIPTTSPDENSESGNFLLQGAGAHVGEACCNRHGIFRSD